jgi:hypothetical protein
MPETTRTTAHTVQQKDESSGQTAGRWKVRLTHPQERKKVVFSSVSENRARQHLANNYPRGTEAYLESPDGKTEHYEHERQGEYGTDADPWAPFDIDSYQPPAEVEPPVSSDWADRTG